MKRFESHKISKEKVPYAGHGLALPAGCVQGHLLSGTNGRIRTRGLSRIGGPLLCILALLFSIEAYPATRYVTTTGAGSKDGSSWENAFEGLQAALYVATSGDQIWVAAGTYKPSSAYDLENTSRYYHFRMIEGVEIYGGFAGTETATGQRTDFGSGGANETILSGDLNGDDVVTGSGATLSFSNNGENCFHVFYHPDGLGLTSASVLDGFTVTGGSPYLNTHGSGIFNDSNSPIIRKCTIKGNNGGSYGGGLYNVNYSSPVITNCVISGNSAYSYGGGLYNYESSSPVITNCVISGNSAGREGGGLYNYGSSSPVITNCVISGNSAGICGGGLYNYGSSSPVITNCVISGNSAYSYGGGLYNSGSTFLVITNCNISGNSASSGGGLKILNSSLVITNCTISGNSGNYGGGLSNSSSSCTLNNSILWGNIARRYGKQLHQDSGTTTLNYSCYSNSDNDIYNSSTFTPDAHCITSNPKFVDAANDDFRIYGSSPCVNTGSNAFVEAPNPVITTDLRGNTRVQNTTIDMGAYEWTAGVDPWGTFYVTSTGAGSKNGESWANAFEGLQAALNVAKSGDQIWVAAGTYHPTIEVGGSGDRYKAFQMKNGVALYGGFAGNENPLTFNLADRDFESNPTILSGDIGTPGTHSDNCYHVFNNTSDLALGSTAILDGFTITGGYADESGNDSGGGMSNTSASPTISNCTFTSNFATARGGGMDNYSSSPAISNCIFTSNSSSNRGGGMYNYSSSPTITNCTFASNSAASISGGGIYNNDSSPVISNCTFISNYAAYRGGGVYNYISSSVLSNCTFLSNVAYSGGGLQIDDCSPTLTNCTFASNSASNSGGGVYTSNSSPVINNCILWGNTAPKGKQICIENLGTTTLNYTCFANETNDVFGTPVTNSCIYSNPRFVNFNEGDCRLFGNSPCVNTGNNSYNSEEKDIAGRTRIQNTTIDMGAYEWTEGTDPAVATLTWDGSSSADWNVGENWNLGFVPVSGDNAVVPDVDNNPVVGANSACNDLSIQSGGLLTINPGFTLTVEGTLTNSAGVTGLVIESDETGTGKLVNNSPGVQATVKQFIEEDDWHYLGIPFTGTPTTLETFKGLWVLKSDEATSEDGSESGWTYASGSDLIAAGTGYGIYHDIDTTLALKGTLVSGDLAVNTVYSNEGWNLIANPYPCTINWEVVDENLSNVNDAIYVWNPTLNGGVGNYATWIGAVGTNDQTQYIAPMQGFFVKATAIGAGSVTFTDAAKTAEASTFKSAEIRHILRLALSDASGATDESVIRIHSSATEAFDGKLDAYKLKATSLTPQLYSVYKGTEYSINSLPEVSEQTVVPFELMIKTSGQHTLALTELTGYNQVLPVMLFNQAGQQLANLQTSDYTFTAQAGEVLKVKLAFNTVLASAEQFQNSFLRVAVDGNNLNLSGLGQGKSTVKLFNTGGQLLQSHQTHGDALQIPNLNRGVYLLRVKDSYGMQQVKKVVIQ